MDTISHNFFNNIFPNEILCIINNIIKKKNRLSNFCNMCRASDCLQFEYLDGVGYICNICRFGL